MLHPKIALFKPFNLLIEHNQHFQTLAANIFYQFAIHTLNISIGTTKMNYTHPSD